MLWILLALLPWRLWAADAMALWPCHIPSGAMHALTHGEHERQSASDETAAGRVADASSPAHTATAHGLAHGGRAAHRVADPLTLTGSLRLTAVPAAAERAVYAGSPPPAVAADRVERPEVAALGSTDTPHHGTDWSASTCALCDLCHNPPLAAQTPVTTLHALEHDWHVPQREPVASAPRSPDLRPPIA